jgi:putative membrane protein
LPLHCGWIIGGLVMLLFWGGLIALVFFTIRAFSSSRQESGHAGSSETALEILKRRYARGEIDRTEYEEKRRDIET